MLKKTPLLILFLNFLIICVNCVATESVPENPATQVTINNSSFLSAQSITINEEHETAQGSRQLSLNNSPSLDELNNNQINESSFQNTVIHIEPIDDLGPLEIIIDKCSQLSSRTKTLLSLIPDITFFTLLTTSLLIDSESALKLTKFFTFPYLLYFLGMAPRRLEICFPNVCGAR